MNWLEERNKFYAELRRNPMARMQEQMADMQAEMIPAFDCPIPEKQEEQPEVQGLIDYEHSDISSQNLKRISALEIQVAGLTKTHHTHTPKKAPPVKQPYKGIR